MARQQTHPALRRGDAARCVARFGFAPRVAGVPVLPPDADETAWLAARRPMLTASEVASALAVPTAHDSPFSLWWKKQPDWPGTPITPNMHIGRKLEAVIGELWSEDHPEAALYRPGAALWAHPIEQWLGATPDYLSVWPNRMTHTCGQEDPHELGCLTTWDGPGVYVEPVECKSDEGGSGWGEPGSDEVPEHHLYQVLTQCIVLGVPRGRIMRLAGKRATEYVIDVERHDDEVARIIKEGRAFWASLNTGVAPDIDEFDATAATLVELYPTYVPGQEAVLSDALVRQFREAKENLRRAKSLEQFAVNQIRDVMGREQAQFAVDSSGARVALRSHFKRRGYEVPPCEIDQIKEAK